MQATSEGVQIRWASRRMSKKGHKTLKRGAEVLVARHDGEDVWARDNGKKGGMKYYLGDTKVIKQQDVTSWLPAFQRKERRWVIKAALAEHNKAHPEELETSPSPGAKKSSSDTTSVYMPGTPDEDLLDTYLKDDLVPDEAAATLIGDARGRQQHNGISVPAKVIIESKARSLITASPPWLIFPYSIFCETIKSCGENPKKRKREDVPSSALQESMWEGIWQRLVNMSSLERQSDLKRLEEDVRLAGERMRAFI